MSEYLRILRLYGRTLDSLKGFSPPDERLVDGQVLALKLLDHAVAAYSLVSGTNAKPVFGTEGSFIHTASLNVLARAVLETYLLYYYIFIAPDTDDEFEFRYCAWQLGGAKREDFAADFPPQTPEGQECLAGQLKLNKELRARIQKTERFKDHSTDTQEKALQGQWRFPKWIDIAKLAGIGPQYSRALFALLTDYAHSGGLSTTQLGATSADDKHELAQSALANIKLIMSRMLVTYIDQFPVAETILENDPEAARLARVYAGALSRVG